MNILQMPVSKTEKVAGKNQYVEVGKVAIHYPTLEEIAGYCSGAKQVKVDEDGVPEYESPIANWIQSAVLASAKASARNKLVSGSIEVKEGLKIPETWEDFTAETGRSGEALAIGREAKAEFAEWISKQGKSEAVTRTLITYFNNRAALELQSAGNKAKVQTYVETFAESLTAEKLERLQRPIQAVIDACSAAVVDLE